GDDVFAPLAVGDADHGDLGDGFVLRDGVFDLAGRELVAAHLQDVGGGAADDGDHAVVNAHDVAGLEPAIMKRSAGGVVVVPIAAHDAGALHPQRAERSGRDVGAVIVDDADRHAGQQ